MDRPGQWIEGATGELGGGGPPSTRRRDILRRANRDRDPRGAVCQHGTAIEADGAPGDTRGRKRRGREEGGDLARPAANARARARAAH
eukprot:13142103-Alexandrium_andersonii.AAC.1